jgi:hypothetical protein
MLGSQLNIKACLFERTLLVVGRGHGCRRSLSMMLVTVSRIKDLEVYSLSENPSAVWVR